MKGTLHKDHVCPSVRRNGTTRLLMDGFSGNVIFEDFSKICWENSSFVKTGQEWRVLYIKTSIHFLIISRSFLLRMRNVSDKSCRENQNTHFVISNFFSLIVPFVRKCGKTLWSGAGRRWQYGASALHPGYLRLRIHTRKLCNTHCFSTATLVAQTCLNATLYTHCLPCSY